MLKVLQRILLPARLELLVGACNQHLEVEWSNRLLVLLRDGHFVHYVDPLQLLRVLSRMESLGDLRYLTVQALARQVVAGLGVLQTPQVVLVAVLLQTQQHLDSRVQVATVADVVHAGVARPVHASHLLPLLHEPAQTYVQIHVQS